MILLLGSCGMERLAGVLRREVEVVVGAWTEVDLAHRLRPTLIYLELLDGVQLLPFIFGGESSDLEPCRAVIHALQGQPLLIRKPRLPSAVGCGPLGPSLPDPFERLYQGQNVLDLPSLWAWHGILAEEVAYGPTHGEARLDATGISRLNGKTALEVEAEVLLGMYQARQGKAAKCLVVDLDETLIYGLVAEDEFASRNPAYMPDGEQPGGSVDAGWWKLRRGLHHALRVMQQRGLVLALATRNDPEVLARRWRKRPREDAPLSGALDALALGPEDFVTIVAGFGDKSEMCRQIAERLGIGLEGLVLLDDSPVERAEVERHVPEVRVMQGTVEDFRQELLFGRWTAVWERTPEAALRSDSYRSRAAVTQTSPSQIEDFLRDLRIQVRVRVALPGEFPRVEELLRRTHQLNLNGMAAPLEGASVWVAFCRDRLADHGLVAAGVFSQHPRELRSWACSCRVLPHRVAPTILWAMLQQEPGALPIYASTGRNGAMPEVLRSLGPAAWVELL